MSSSDCCFSDSKCKINAVLELHGITHRQSTSVNHRADTCHLHIKKRVKYSQLNIFPICFFFSGACSAAQMPASCCLCPLAPWTPAWTRSGAFCPERSPRRRAPTTGPCGRRRSTSRSCCCAWRRRTRGWRVSRVAVEMLILLISTTHVTWRTGMRNTLSLTLKRPDCSLWSRRVLLCFWKIYSFHLNFFFTYLVFQQLYANHVNCGWPLKPPMIRPQFRG